MNYNTFFEFLTHYQSEQDLKFSQQYQAHYYLLPLAQENIHPITLDNKTFDYVEHHLSVFDSRVQGAFHYTATLRDRASKKSYKVHVYYDKQHDLTPDRSISLFFKEEDKEERLFLSQHAQNEFYSIAEYMVRSTITNYLKEQKKYIERLDAELHQKIERVNQHEEKQDYQSQYALIPEVISELSNVIKIAFYQQSYYKSLLKFYQGAQAILGQMLTSQPVVEAEKQKEAQTQEDASSLPTEEEYVVVTSPKKLELDFSLVMKPIEFPFELLTLIDRKMPMLADPEVALSRHKEIFEEIEKAHATCVLQDLTFDQQSHKDSIQSYYEFTIALKNTFLKWEKFKIKQLERSFLLKDFVKVDLYAASIGAIIDKLLPVAIKTDRVDILRYLIENNYLDLNQFFVFEHQTCTPIEAALTRYKISHDDTSTAKKSTNCFYLLSEIMHDAMFYRTAESGFPIFHEIDRLCGTDAILLNDHFVKAYCNESFKRKAAHAFKLAQSNPALSEEVLASLKMFASAFEKKTITNPALKREMLHYYGQGFDLSFFGDLDQIFKINAQTLIAARSDLIFNPRKNNKGAAKKNAAQEEALFRSSKSKDLFRRTYFLETVGLIFKKIFQSSGSVCGQSISITELTDSGSELEDFYNFYHKKPMSLSQAKKVQATYDKMKKKYDDVRQGADLLPTIMEYDDGLLNEKALFWEKMTPFFVQEGMIDSLQSDLDALHLSAFQLLAHFIENSDELCAQKAVSIEIRQKQNELLVHFDDMLKRIFNNYGSYDPDGVKSLLRQYKKSTRNILNKWVPGTNLDFSEPHTIKANL